MTLKLDIVPLDQLQNYCGATKSTSNEHLLREQLRWLLEPYALTNFRLGYSGGVWRARLCPSPEGYPTFVEMWHPPPHLTNPGRLNELGKPILYGSLHNRIALQEIGAKTGDHVQLVNYRVDPHLKLCCCVTGEFLAVQRTGRSWVSEELGQYFNHILKQLPPRDATSFVYLDAFMSEILRDRNAAASEYLSSRTLASLIFEKYPEVDAMLYPSVAAEGGKNVAIRPEVAAKVLSVASSAVVRIEGTYDYSLCEFQVLKYAIPPWTDETFQWIAAPTNFKWEPDKYIE